MSNPADTDALKALHSQLATVLKDAIANPGEKGVQAAVLNVARQFLKDNGIDAIPATGTPLGAVAEEVAKHPFDPSELTH